MKHNPPKNKYQSKAIRRKYKDKKKANMCYKRPLPFRNQQHNIEYIKFQTKEGMEYYNDIVQDKDDHVYYEVFGEYGLGYCSISNLMETVKNDLHLDALLKDYEIIEISDYQN
jgi:hypothetical protein